MRLQVIPTINLDDEGVEAVEFDIPAGRGEGKRGIEQFPIERRVVPPPFDQVIHLITQ